jgi:hypothetical protein
MELNERECLFLSSDKKFNKTTIDGLSASTPMAEQYESQRFQQLP